MTEEKISTSVDGESETRICAQCGHGMSVIRGLAIASFNCVTCGQPFYDHPDSGTILAAQAAAAQADPGPVPDVELTAAAVPGAEVDDPELAGLKIVLEELAGKVERMRVNFSDAAQGLERSIVAQREALADFEATQDELTQRCTQFNVRIAALEVAAGLDTEPTDLENGNGQEKETEVAPATE